MMRQSKKLIGFVMCLSLLLSGCGGKIGSQVSELLNQYIGPEYYARKAAEASASAAAAAEASAPADTIPSSDDKEEEVATDVETLPWEAVDGVLPKDIIGRITIVGDNLKIRQYGGTAALLVGYAHKGETYLCSQIYMDGSGNKWYCIGRNMWLLVVNMDDIDYEKVTVTKTASTPSTNG